MPASPAEQEIECPAEIVQVGRQPILDRQRRTYGYELLYRAGGRGLLPGMDGDLATARTVLNSFLEFGLQQLAGGHPVFINLTRPFFTDLPPLPLDARRLVLEVLEDIPVDDALRAGLTRLRKAGYRLALDDYRFEPHWEPLLPLADVVKVDIRDLDLSRHGDAITALKERGLTLLAEKVETEAEFALTRDLGFDLFQGYFFARPQVVSGARLQSNQQVLTRLLKQINDPDTDIDTLARLVAQDANLSFKLLRFINSAALGLPRAVNSIHQAVVLIGLARLRAWATLFTMAGLSSKAPELITTSLVRAELCQRLARRTGRGDPDSGYTVGLLSVMDAVLDRPMAEVVKELGLSAPMIEALVALEGPYGAGLQCTLAVEQGQWLAPAAQLLSTEELTGLYVDALSQAETIRTTLSD